MHRLLEDYLSQVENELRPMPAEQREQDLREMRQHLLKAIAVNQEVTGHSEEKATENAIKEFGSPQKLAAEMLSAWRRGDKKENRRSLIGALLCQLASKCIISILFIAFGFSILTTQYGKHELLIGSLLVLWNATSLAATGIVSAYFFPMRAIAATWILAVVDICITWYQISHTPVPNMGKELHLAAFDAIISPLWTILFIHLVIRRRTNRKRAVA